MQQNVKYTKYINCFYNIHEDVVYGFGTVLQLIKSISFVLNELL